MLTGNRVNVGTIAIALFREIEQCPDLVEGKAEIAGAADEAQTAKVPTAIAAIGTARQRNARGIAGLIVRLEFQMGSFSGQAVVQQLAVIGVPCGAGACGVGQKHTASAMRTAGLISR